MSHQLLGRQQRHRKERAKSRHEAAEKRQASSAIYQHQLEQHATATQQALAAGVPAPAAPEAPKSKRRQHHTKDGSIRNHRGVKRAPRGGRGGGRPADGSAAERKDGEKGEGKDEDDEDDDEDEEDEGSKSGRALDDEKEDSSSDYTSASSSEDEAPPEAAVYSFVPTRPASHSSTAAQSGSKPAPGTNRPVLPPSLREQSLLVAKQQSTQQRDELDELLHMDGGGQGRGGATGGPSGVATLTDGKGQKAKGEELRNLEDELDDLLNL